MAFFGATKLGPQNPFTAIHVEALDVSLFVDDDFGEAFDKVAKDGFLDAEDTLAFMTELFHGPPPGPELARIRERLAAFVGSCGERGRADRDETIQLMATMRDEADALARSVGDPHSDMKRDPKEYSYDAICERRRRGQNPFAGPKDELMAPMTMNQEVGWTLQDGDEKDVLAELKPKTKSDATKFAEHLLKTGEIG